MSCPTLVKSAVISALAGFCLVSSAQDHELTTDVVVIGGGISGLSSAMSVLDHGGKVVVLEKLPGLPTLAADSGFFHLEARIHRAFQNFKIYVGVATTFVSGKCSFLLKAEGASTRLRASKLNNADIRSNKPAS